MEEPKVLEVSFWGSHSECRALALFVKRVKWHEIRECAVDNDEAEKMVEALEVLRAGLARDGFVPP